MAAAVLFMILMSVPAFRRLFDRFAGAVTAMVKRPFAGLLKRDRG